MYSKSFYVHVRWSARRFVIACAFLMFGSLVVTPSARSEITWPLEFDLLCKDWSQNEVQSWVDVGDVTIWNTKLDLIINVEAGEGFYLSQVNIMVTEDDQESFKPILNKKGKPIPEKFTLKYFYPVSELREKHMEYLPLFEDPCWGSPDECPMVRYIIVWAELFSLDADGYMNIGEGAYAEGDGTFDRNITGNSDEEGTEWGWYIIYPVMYPE